jgi:hypothetical protein
MKRYFIYHNPHSPTGMDISRVCISEDSSNDSRLDKLQAEGRATFYNSYRNGPKSIVVKTCNVITVDLPKSKTTLFALPIDPNILQSILELTNEYRLAGKLHDFDITNYPELLI